MPMTVSLILSNVEKNSLFALSLPMIVLLILLHDEKLPLLLSHSLTAWLNAGIGSRLQWWTWVKLVPI